MFDMNELTQIICQYHRNIYPLFLVVTGLIDLRFSYTQSTNRWCVYFDGQHMSEILSLRDHGNNMFFSKFQFRTGCFERHQPEYPTCLRLPRQLYFIILVETESNLSRSEYELLRLLS